METTVKKREWVKDAAIVFLAVLLVLTFFSNTIMNRSLPEVATAAVSSGSIVARVRGSGIVTATGKQQVKAKETRTIRSVMVKVGQEVNTGDVLFVLGEGDETALEQAMNTLRSLQYDYRRQAMNVPTYDGSSYDHSVDSAYERMIRAEQARDKAAEAYQLALSRDSAGDVQVTSAEIARVEAQLKDVADQLDTAQSAYDERVNRAWEELSQAEWEYDNADTSGDIYVDEDGLIDEGSSGQAVSGDRDELWKKVEEARQHLAEVQSDVHLSSLRSQYDSLLERYNTLLQHRDNYTPDSVIPYRDALDTAEAELTDARLYYDEAVAAREYAYQNFEQKVAVEQVNLAETAENIRIQQEKIKSLAGEEENVVSAAVSGTISTIDCTAGDTVLKDALLCTIEVPDMGHTLSFSVTNDQAQRLRIGDTATVSNYYWGNSVTATLTTIRTDPKNPQTNKILTFDLVGDVTSGAEMSISVGQKSANYDIVVPNSAIKSDSNGSFVLLVSVKSSPLGNRYTAKRVSVEVLANDDNNSAVVADLSNGDYVITTSSAPVASGDMVRMADSA